MATENGEINILQKQAPVQVVLSQLISLDTYICK